MGLQSFTPAWLRGGLALGAEDPWGSWEALSAVRPKQTPVTLS